jgi:putative ABC transport system substrate-binding protein
MRRRDFIAIFAGTAAASVLGARFPRAQPGKLWRIGFISGGTAVPTDKPFTAFALGMRELGYIEGKDFVIEWRSAYGQYERFSEITEGLVKSKIDVVVIATSAAVRPVQQASGATPIVMAYSTDPVGNGFVDSLAKPGGNTTGLAGASDDASPKQVELMQRMLPNLNRLGILGNPDNPAYAAVLRSTIAAASSIGIASFPIEARNEAEIDLAFAKTSGERVQAIKIIPDALFFSRRARMADLALQHRLPSIYGQRECAEAGGFMSYGESLADFLRRAATFVDKILKGAKPGDLPIEQPNQFEFVINLKTAKLLGIDVPHTLVAFADAVIE